MFNESFGSTTALSCTQRVNQHGVCHASNRITLDIDARRLCCVYPLYCSAEPRPGLLTRHASHTHQCVCFSAVKNLVLDLWLLARSLTNIFFKVGKLYTVLQMWYENKPLWIGREIDFIRSPQDWSVTSLLNFRNHARYLLSHGWHMNIRFIININ